MDTSSCRLRAVVRSNVTAYRTFVIGAETVGATAGARSTRCATAASATDMIAAAVAAEQVVDLVDHGVTELHFYTMNRADLVYAVCHLLGLRPEAKAAA